MRELPIAARKPGRISAARYQQRDAERAAETAPRDSSRRS